MKQSPNRDMNISKMFERNTDEFVENETKYKPRIEKINILRWLRAVLINSLRMKQSINQELNN